MSSSCRKLGQRPLYFAKTLIGLAFYLSTAIGAQATRFTLRTHALLCAKQISSLCCVFQEKKTQYPGILSDKTNTLTFANTVREAGMFSLSLSLSLSRKCYKGKIPENDIDASICWKEHEWLRPHTAHTAHRFSRIEV